MQNASRKEGLTSVDRWGDFWGILLKVCSHSGDQRSQNGANSASTSKTVDKAWGGQRRQTRPAERFSVFPGSYGASLEANKDRYNLISSLLHSEVWAGKDEPLKLFLEAQRWAWDLPLAVPFQLENVLWVSGWRAVKEWSESPQHFQSNWRDQGWHLAQCQPDSGWK